MKKTKAGIIQCTLSLIMCLTLCLGLVPPAYASDVGIVDVAKTIWSWAGGISKDVISWITGNNPDFNSETATPEDWQTAYNQYVTNIQNNYNTTNIDSSGLSGIPVTGWHNYSVDEGGTIVSTRSDTLGLSFYSGVTSCYSPVGRKLRGNQTYDENSYFHSSPFSVPVSGTYTLKIPSFTFQSGSLESWKQSTASGWYYRYYFHVLLSTDGGETWMLVYTSSRTRGTSWEMSPRFSRTRGVW